MVANTTLVALVTSTDGGSPLLVWSSDVEFQVHDREAVAEVDDAAIHEAEAVHAGRRSWVDIQDGFHDP